MTPATPAADVPSTLAARPWRRSAAWINVLIFLAAFATFQWGIDRLASPFQGADKVERKFAYFAAHKDDYDFVFIGSSRVMNQISPKVFDEQMAAAGRPCRSFNFGYAAMFLPECSFLIDEIRALHPARLRGMLVEVSSPAARHDSQHTLMAREIYWHRPVPTALACAAVLTDPSATFAVPERREQLWRQVTILARCLTHLGYGPDLLEHFKTLRRRHADARRASRDVLGSGLDGFTPLLTTLGHGKTGVFKTGGSARDLADFQESVAALRTETAPSTSAAEETLASKWGLSLLRHVLSREVAALRDAGIEPVFFIGPGTTREQLFLDLHADGTLPTLLAFNDPVAYPELYQSEMRADRYHLNAQGADLLTRLLVRRLTTVQSEKDKG